MKKLFSILLAVAMLASVATVASAANTTVLTTTVPAATYTLNIPADQEISFGATKTNIGAISVTDAAGFAVGKNLKVTIAYDAFTCDGVTTTIPYTVNLYGVDYQNSSKVTQQEQLSGSSFVFLGQSNGEVKEYTQTVSGTYTYEFKETEILIDSEDWGKALAGEYTATITFTAEVVVEE